MPNSVRSYPNKLPSVIVASLNLELLPFLETVPSLRVSTSVALPACHPLLLIRGGYLCQSQQPPRGLSALALHPMICSIQEGLASARLWVVPPSGLGNWISWAATNEFQVVT